MTVLELVRKLLECSDLTAIVVIGKGTGPVGDATETVNGFVILDRVMPQ